MIRAATASLLVVSWLVTALTWWAVRRPDRMVSGLDDFGEPGWALWLAWWAGLGAGALTVARLLLRRSPWPWAVAVLAQLVVLAGTAARLRHWADPWQLTVVVGVVAVGLVSLLGELASPRGDEH